VVCGRWVFSSKCGGPGCSAQSGCTANPISTHRHRPTQSTATSAHLDTDGSEGSKGPAAGGAAGSSGAGGSSTDPVTVTAGCTTVSSSAHRAEGSSVDSAAGRHTGGSLTSGSSVHTGAAGAGDRVVTAGASSGAVGTADSPIDDGSIAVGSASSGCSGCATVGGDGAGTPAPCTASSGSASSSSSCSAAGAVSPSSSSSLLGGVSGALGLDAGKTKVLGVRGGDAG